MSMLNILIAYSLKFWSSSTWLSNLFPYLFHVFFLHYELLFNNIYVWKFFEVWVRGIFPQVGFAFVSIRCLEAPPAWENRLKFVRASLWLWPYKEFPPPLPFKTNIERKFSHVFFYEPGFLPHSPFQLSYSSILWGLGLMLRAQWSRLLSN